MDTDTTTDTQATPVRVEFTLVLDLKTWADEYGMTLPEARQALRATAKEAMLQYLENNGFQADAR